MKKIIVVLIFSIAMIVSLSNFSFAGEREEIRVFGITLGKSLSDSGVPECDYKPSKYSTKFKDYDYKSHDCYKESDIGTSCFTVLNKKLSFYVSIYLMLQDKCDRQSPVQEIQVSFNSDDYPKMMLFI
jgi:hypothetical protein